MGGNFRGALHTSFLNAAMEIDYISQGLPVIAQTSLL